MLAVEITLGAAGRRVAPDPVLPPRPARRHLLNKPRLRNVMEDGNAEDSRLLLLDEALTAEAGLLMRGWRMLGQSAALVMPEVHMGRALVCDAVDLTVHCSRLRDKCMTPPAPCADLEGREVAGAGGEPARSLAQFIRDEGLALARTQVAVDYSYWPAHTVLQVGGLTEAARQ